MNTKDLSAYFARKRVHPLAVRINKGDGVEQYCIHQDDKGRWLVYYAERGHRVGLRTFSHESTACNHLREMVDGDGGCKLR